MQEIILLTFTFSFQNIGYSSEKINTLQETQTQGKQIQSKNALVHG